MEDKKEYKKEIIDLATSHSLVTDYTSLIVLEDVRDYIKYNITPPEELLAEYNRIKNNSNTKKEIVKTTPILNTTPQPSDVAPKMSSNKSIMPPPPPPPVREIS